MINCTCGIIPEILFGAVQGCGSRKYQSPDFVVVEGPKAGGTSGFFHKKNWKDFREIPMSEGAAFYYRISREYGEKVGRKIPVLAAWRDF